MMKMNSPMVIPRQEIAKACLNYGYDAFALCLQQNEIFSEKTIGTKTVLQLIDTFIAIGEWNNAHAIWKHYSSSMPSINRPETVAKLRLWDKVMPIYQEKFKRGNTDAFTGLIKSLSSMAKWPEMVDLMKTFTKLNLSGQSKWDELDLALYSSPDDSLRRAALQAISALH